MINFDLQTILDSLPISRELLNKLTKTLVRAKVLSLDDLILFHVFNPCSLVEFLADTVLVEEWEMILFYACSNLIPSKSSWEYPYSLQSTGSQNLDELLRGGLLPGSTYDIYGEAGTGKSTVAMQVCIRSVLKQNSTIYFALEPFSHARLYQLFNHQISASNDEVDFRGALENFVICEIPDWRTLLLRMSMLEGVIQALHEQSKDVKFIVIDSIAALQCMKENARSISEKDMHHFAISSRIIKIAFFCRHLSKKYGIATVFVNQVRSADGITVPALGFTLSKFIPNRILTKKVKLKSRRILAVYSTYLTPDSVEFHIESGGVM